MHDDNATQLLQAQIDDLKRQLKISLAGATQREAERDEIEVEAADLRAREKVLKRTVKEQREQIEALRARLSPRERLRDALAVCPACGPPKDEELSALTEEEVMRLLSEHAGPAKTNGPG